MRKPAQGRVLLGDHAAALRRLVTALTIAIAALTGAALPATAAPGDISTVAGDGTFGSSGDGGPATAASIGSPEGVFFSPAGLHLMEDAGPRLRHVDLAGTISTIAGGGLNDPGDGGPATQALLQDPEQVIRDRNGNLYFSSGNRVRRVSALGIITTVAGTGTAGFSGDGGQATAAQLARPHGLALDLNGNLYVGDCDNYRIRRVSALGVITTVAGNGAAGYSGDGGPATAAQLSCPADVTVDPWGRLFIGDNGNNVVRQVDQATGTISTFAGTGVAGYTGDGGPATAATLRGPQGLETDGTGSLYIAESHNHIIRKVDVGGTITTVAGTAAGAGSENSASFSGDGGPAMLATLNGPRDVAFDSASGDLYIADRYNNRIRRVEALGAPDLPPSVTIDSSPAGVDNDVTPTWAFSASGTQQVSFECRLTRGAVVVSDWATCTSARTYDLSAEPDGSYTFHVRAITVSGEGPPSSSGPYLLDTVAPAAPAIDSSPPSPDTATAVSWAFSGEGGASFECRLRKGALVISNWAPCSGSQGYSLVDGDGIYTFEVRQTDVAGNVSPITARTYELDRASPSPPAIVGSPPSPGADDTPTWMVVGEASALLECRLTRGAAVISDWTGCLSPRTYDLTGEPDGTYTFSVRQTDLAGNVSAPATSDYELDRAAAGAPTIGSGPPATGNDPTPTWNFSGEAGATFTCRIEDALGQPVSGYDWGACSSPATFDLSGEPDGSYSFLVRQTDPAGNTSAPTQSDYLLDTSAPGTPTFDSTPGGQGTATNPAWSFSGEAGASFECRVDRGVTQVSDWAACSSPHALDLTAEPDGVYTLSVRALDAAGNRSGPASDDYALDRLSPAAPTMTGTPGAVGNDGTPTWSFVGEAGALLTCRLERGATIVQDWQACTSPSTHDLGAAPDGVYRFLVRATDGAGNVGPETESSYELDRLAPSVPTIDSGPGSLGNSRTPTWTFTGDLDAVHECRLTHNGQVVDDWAACAGISAHDLTGEPDGTYVFEVRGRDDAGNVGAAATSLYQLDTVGADVTIESGPAALGNSSNPVWWFVGEPGASFQCRLENAGGVLSDWADCTSPHGYDLSSSPDGSHTFFVRSADTAGNVGDPVGYAFELDRVAPQSPAFTVAPPALGNDTSPRWEFVAEAGAVVECGLAREGTPGVWDLCAGGRSYDLTAQGDGNYELLLRATDGAGNVSPTSSSAYRLDATAPDAPRITEGPGARGRERRVSWAFTGEAGAAFDCRLARGGTVLDSWTACGSPSNFNLTGSNPGDHTFSVRATDAAGNLGSTARSDYELLASAEPEEPKEERDRPGGGGGPPPGGGSDPGPSAPAPASEPAPGPVGAAPPAPADDKGQGRRRRNPADGDGRGAGIPIHPDRDEVAPLDFGDRSTDDPKSLAERLIDALGAAAAWTGRNLDKTAFPLALLLLVLGYMGLQNRLDRKDPKLALAPVHADSTLEFLPPPSLREGGGRGQWADSTT